MYEPQEFCTKPVYTTAVQWDGDVETLKEFMKYGEWSWCSNAMKAIYIPHVGQHKPTRCEIGSWILRFTGPRYEVMNDAEFQEKYEPQGRGSSLGNTRLLQQADVVIRDGKVTKNRFSSTLDRYDELMGD